MPASGARSGTQPSRSERGAGDGRVVATTKLACGHVTSGPIVTRYPGGRTQYRCEACGTLVDKAKRQ